MSVYSSVIKKSSSYFVSTLLSRMLSFFLLPIYTRYLSAANYGVLELLDTTVYLFAALVAVRVGESLLYYYAAAKSEESKAVVASTAMLGGIGLAVGGVGIGGALFLAPLASRVAFGSTEYTAFFRLTFATLGLGLSLDIGLTYLRALDKALQFSLVSVGRLVVCAAVAVPLLVVWKLGVWAMLWANLAGAAAVELYLIAYIVHRTGFRFDWSSFKAQIRYAAPLTVSGLLVLFIHYGGRLFLQRYATLAEVGVYSLGYKFGILVSTVHAPFSLYWTSQMFNIVRKEDGDRAYVRIYTYLITTLVLAGAAISIFIRPVLKVMAGPEFQGAYLFVPWIAMAYILRGVGDQARSVFNIHKKPGRHLHVTIAGAVVSLALYWLLIPRFHSWGAVAASVGTFLAMAAISIWQAQKIRYYDLEYGRIGHALAIAAAGVVAAGLVTPHSLAAQLLASAAIFAAVLAAFALTGFLRQDERRQLAAVATELRGRPATVAAAASASE